VHHVYHDGAKLGCRAGTFQENHLHNVQIVT